MKLALIHEAWFGVGKRGAAGPWQRPEYQTAYAAMVKKHGGDEKAAQTEFVQLMQTPAGQYQLQRQSMQIKPQASEVNPEKLQFKAARTSGAGMFQ